VVNLEGGAPARERWDPPTYAPGCRPPRSAGRHRRRPADRRVRIAAAERCTCAVRRRSWGLSVGGGRGLVALSGPVTRGISMKHLGLFVWWWALGGVAVGGCLPVSDFGSGGETMESAGSGGGMTASSGPGVTGSGGVTSEGLTGVTSTSSTSGSGSEPMATSTAACTEGLFICETDMLIGPECDIFAQECPEGQKCAPVITDGLGAWNSDRCVPVTGSDMAGEPCTAESVADGLDSCVEGVMCWGVDKEGNGTCVAHCGGTPDAPLCPDNGACSIAGGGYLAVCLPGCDPLLQNCAVGAGCYPIDGQFTCAPDASGDAGEANEPCAIINICASGLWCAEEGLVGAGCAPGSMGCCTPFCEFPDGTCPNPDQQCVQFFDPKMLPEGDPLLDIGYCGVPK